MSVSTDGMLFFGIVYGEGDVENFYDATAEWNRSHQPTQPQGLDYSPPEWDAWRKLNRAWERNGNKIEQGNYCSGEYPMYYVALSRHHRQASRGDPLQVDPMKLIVTEHDVQILREFCEKAGLPWKDPKWWLASYWG